MKLTEAYEASGVFDQSDAGTGIASHVDCNRD